MGLATALGIHLGAAYGRLRPDIEQKRLRDAVRETYLAFYLCRLCRTRPSYASRLVGTRRDAIREKIAIALQAPPISFPRGNSPASKEIAAGFFVGKGVGGMLLGPPRPFEWNLSVAYSEDAGGAVRKYGDAVPPEHIARIRETSRILAMAARRAPRSEKD